MVRNKKGCVPALLSYSPGTGEMLNIKKVASGLLYLKK